MIIKDTERLQRLDYAERLVVVNLAFNRGPRTFHKMTVAEFNALPPSCRWTLNSQTRIAKLKNNLGIWEWGVVEFKEKP